MEDFHASLYVLYHYQMSPFQLAKASESIGALKVKMDALNTGHAARPAQGEDRCSSSTQRARLSKSVDEVAALLDGKDESKIKAAIEMMHSQYQSLEKVF